MSFLSYLFVIIGTIFCFVVFYNTVVRYVKIKGLGENIIKKRIKDDYLKVVQKYIITSFISTLLSFISIISPIMELRLIIPIIGFMICVYLYQILLDDIEDFDMSKKDSDILNDFLNNRLEDAKLKSKENKIKKIDSLDDREKNEKKEE